MAHQLIPQLVFRNGEEMPSRPAYFEKRGGSWVPTTWRTYADEVEAAGKALIALGVEPGQTVTILGFNRPEWVIMDMAAMAIGAVPAGIYTTNSPAECQYIVAHSESPVVLVENEEQWAKIDEVRGELPNVRHVVTMRPAAAIGDPLTMTWDEFVAAGSNVTDEVFQQRLDGLAADQLATLIYTSGTTGPPKGVMLSHENLEWTPRQVLDVLALSPDDRVLSYLPLSHIAEQLFTIHAAAMVGYAVYYAESLEALPENLKEVKPTLFFAVPRVWERFHTGVAAELAKATGAKAKIAAWATGVGLKKVLLDNEGKHPSPVLAAQYAVADKLVLSKVRAALGLDETRVAISGAAPVATEVLEFLAGFGIQVLEVYGQSEDTGPTTLNVPGRTRFGSVGPAFPNVEVKIADDGEVLVRGRNVFLGYYKDPEATAEALVDGWLQSGDLGSFDEAGLLTITGRKKDIIITAGGKNVAPKPIEAGLKTHRLISEAVVIGDRRKFLSVVVTVDEDAAAELQSEASDTAPVNESEVIRNEVQQAVDELNQRLARVEQVKRFVVLPRQLSIEGGELTPTLKVKRNKVAEHFSDVIDEMYAD